MFEATLAPTFPPLLKGVAVPNKADPFTKAIAAATTAEVEPGRIHYAERDDLFSVAVTFAPEEPLQSAARIGFAAMLGLNDALGALAPPEVAVHFEWPNRIKVNGAACGTMRMAASTNDPAIEPDWLIAGLNLSVQAEPSGNAGVHKDRTTLHDEGCGDVTVPRLIESWSRHLLVWVNRYLDDGFSALHAAWRDKCDTVGEQITDPAAGTFTGLDENGSMLLRKTDTTVLLTLNEYGLTN
ncbi:MAG: hypothetical protein HRU32_16440 [Rhodobacteraceae bacterium]|nr:hypothetical protein [Paracoccaceae bacterium]